MLCTETTKQIMVNLATQFVIRNEEFKPEYNREYNMKLERGIHFCVELDVEQFGYENDGNTYHEDWAAREVRYLHFIVTGYHSVYLGITKFNRDKRNEYNVEEIKEWKNTSNHDSCWREDGFRDLWREFINMYNRVYSNTPDEHRPAPIASTYKTTLRSKWLSGPVFDFVEVITEFAQNGDYHKKVLSVKNIKKTVEI